MGKRHLHSRYLAAIITLLTALGTVHAVGATSREVAQFKNLFAAGVAPGALANLKVISPNSRVTSTSFLVPLGKKFVVTEVTIVPDRPSTGSNAVSLIQDPFDTIIAPRLSWVVSNESSAAMSYATGVVIGTGSHLQILNGILFNATVSDGPISVWVSGYLVASGQPISPLLRR